MMFFSDVIHTVGPRGENPQLLESCYRNCLNYLLEYNIKSIAFCGISTGIYGYPLDKATHIALRVVREWLENESNRSHVQRHILFFPFLSHHSIKYFNNSFFCN
jgi:O-acetyl-ADP-ribose deacetylase (regulator of RNase III)